MGAGGCHCYEKNSQVGKYLEFDFDIGFYFDFGLYSDCDFYFVFYFGKRNINLALLLIIETHCCMLIILILGILVVPKNT